MEARLKRFQAEHRGLANSRQAFDAKRASDPAFSAEIESLYRYFVGTFARYCGNCWHDAFIQLLTIKKMNSKSQFRVLAGTLLHDPLNRDVRYMLTPQRLADMGDDLALRHLANNPKAIDYFEKPLPANLDELIADYRKRHDAEAPADAAPVSEEEASKETEKAAQPGRGGRRNSATAAKQEKAAAPVQASDDPEKAADPEQTADGNTAGAAPVSEEEAPKETEQDGQKHPEEYVEVPSGDR